MHTYTQVHGGKITHSLVNSKLKHTAHGHIRKTPKRSASCHLKSAHRFYALLNEAEHRVLILFQTNLFNLQNKHITCIVLSCAELAQHIHRTHAYNVGYKWKLLYPRTPPRRSQISPAVSPNTTSGPFPSSTVLMLRHLFQCDTNY